MARTDDPAAAQKAMLRALGRLRSELARERSGDGTAARRIALALVEHALTEGSEAQPDAGRDSAPAQSSRQR